ncbi:hypothetical protein HPB49_010359 [Dermacentor silvarum]|uniref:Uncharacterized protein n=1 Tax=Dermacentor silvarum TaxID=543639 RepID=A0ACB8DCN4_DERSI|nr:hypothetical protein HPB49_010359 [Dermacentor silvarum]
MAAADSDCRTLTHFAMECVKDHVNSCTDVEVLRSNITNDDDASRWVEEYGLKTNTSWVVDFAQPTAKCQRMVFHKIWRCKECKRNKSSGMPAVHCPAKIDLKIQKVNRNTKRNDAFLRGEKPLPAVIKLFHHSSHSHSTAAAEALRRLAPTSPTKQAFLEYFNNGMSPAEAIRLHESKLVVQENGYALVANSAVNPVPSAIYYWHKLWREENFGRDIDPLLKIAEKMPLYAKEGLDVKLGRSEDGQFWVVLVYPQAFMTDNSAAEKAALQAVWPQGTQLLCFFHVAQAEWRWLTAGRNNIGKEQRRSLMSAFRQIMYADSTEKLESAIKNFRESSHTSYLSRVEAFLDRKEEWVLLFRSKLTTLESISEVWELYFKSRILKHAHNRVPTHQLLYDSLLKKTPEGAQASVVSLGDNCFLVPSFQKNGEIYDVCRDIGTCTCRAGCTDAFCKHQALVHKHFGGIFPNCPALTITDRHELGRLALGDLCPGIEFFSNFCDTNEVQSEHGPALQQEMCPANANENEERADPPAVLGREVCPTSGLEQQDSQDVDNNLEALFEQMRQIHAEEKGNETYRRHLLSGTKRLKRLQEQKRGIGAMMAMDAALGLELRRGRCIKVQPTATSRRRPGVTRGSKRVAAGRPPSGPSPKRAKKRRHVLQQSVDDNIPHVKLHGYGH